MALLALDPSDLRRLCCREKEPLLPFRCLLEKEPLLLLRSNLTGLFTRGLALLLLEDDRLTLNCRAADVFL